MELSATTDPARRSFVPVDANSCFPIQNLPFGVFQPVDGTLGCGVAIGDFVLDLEVLDEAGLLPSFDEVGLFSDFTFNRFGSLGRTARRGLRCRLSQLLDIDETTIRNNASLWKRVFHSRGEVQMLLPMAIGDYTDFYASKEHATNVGALFRGADNALHPNWLHLPVGASHQPDELARWVSGKLFDGEEGRQAAARVDRTISALPGFSDARLLGGWLDRKVYH